MEMFKELSHFIKGISFDDAAAEFEDGKKIYLKDASPVLKISEKVISVAAEMGEYKAEFSFAKKDGNSVECSALFKPENKVKNKVRRITAFKGKVKYNNDTGVLLNGSGFEDGVSNPQNMPAKTKAQYFCSFFDESNATTFSAVLPCKLFRNKS